MGCPGEAECEEHGHSDQACVGCPMRVETEASAGAESYIPYLEYLVESKQRRDWNLPVEFRGLDSFFIIPVHREIERFQQEILDRKKELAERKKEKEKENE